MNGGSLRADWRVAEDADAAPLELGAESILPNNLLGEDEGGSSGLVGPALAIVATLAWAAFALWFARDSLPLMTAPALVEYAAALAAPPALGGIAWLLLRRSSRAEARGFARTAARMRMESAALERSVATLSAAIDTNRIKLADQAEALAQIAGEATERLAGVGQGFALEIAQANRHAAALSAATHEAQTGLGVLLATLPRARAETLEAADALDRIARAADDHAMALDSRLEALADQGAAAERVAETAAARLAEQVGRIDTSSGLAAARLEEATDAASHAMTTLLSRAAVGVERTGRALGEATDAAGRAVDAVLARAGEGVAAAGRDLDAHGRAMAEAVAQHQVTLDGAAREAADALGARIEVIEIAAERLARRLEEQRGIGVLIVGELEGGVERVSGQLDALHDQGVERTGRLAAAITALGGSADAMTRSLREGEEVAARAIGSAEALLTASDAAVRELDETLPEALDRLDARIVGTRQAVAQAKPELLALVTAAESTNDAISGMADVIAEQRTALDALSAKLLDALDVAHGRADGLGADLDDSVGRANRFANEAAPRLIEALLRVRETADAAAGHARETIAGVIPQAAERLEAASAAAVERAAGAAVEERIAALGRAADAAAAAAAGAAVRLGDRLRAIDDAAALVETRLAEAQAVRETAERDSFARRSAQLIEAMNSAAIDITKSLAPDVADGAWAAYLKGDRGVFTRRAVRLLDAGEAREIARLYDEAEPFREQVNRYIHDFEAMLRGVLAQREGSPLGVTLLSSDMGKLYVALAQAIERLR